ncbi:MAG: ADOP family duplicated permease [Candidatus Acidiferrales bacterium]
MRLLSLTKSFLRSHFRRQQIDAELDDEIRSTVEMLADQKIKEGMPPDQARRVARIELGGVEQVKEEVRAVRVGAWFDTLLQDLRFGLRMLRKNPEFTAVAILTLALGIGANTAIFSVVDAVLLRPLPIPEPNQVVSIYDSLPSINFPRAPVSVLQFRDYSARSDVFASTALLRRQRLNVTAGGQTQRLNANRVTASLFPLLGIRPILGRTFVSADDLNANAHVTVLSAALWRGMFGGDPRAIGKNIRLDGIEYRVIGVEPASISAIDPITQLWVPMGLTPKDFTEDQRWSLVYQMRARLRPGVSTEQARAAMSVEAARVTASVANDRMHAGIVKGFGILVSPLKSDLVGNVEQSLNLLFGAVFLVLLIACANIASLLLGRGSARSREVAVRAAIGAGRSRVLRQLLTESLMLSICGGGCGVALGYWGVRLLVRFAPASVPQKDAIGISPLVLGFTFAVAALAGIIFGLAPAMQASHVDVPESLKQGGGGHSAGQRQGFQRALVISEAALTCMLLVGAGLLSRTLAKLMQVNPGFDPTNVVTLRISPPQQIVNIARYRAFADDLLDRVSSLAGVRHAALAFDPPLFHDETSALLSIRGYQTGPNDPQPHAEWVDATPGYFAAMGIPLLRGRIYTQAEMGAPGSSAQKVVVIDQAFAQRFWRGKNPVGQQIGYEDNHGRWFTIVGVVGTVRESSLAALSEGMVYYPRYYPGATLVVRTTSDPRPLIGVLRRQVHSAGPGQAVYNVETMSQRVAESVSQQRFAAILLGLFAGLAVILAAVGIYGVTAYAVTTRTHEIGIRMALGAQPKRILRDVLGNVGKMALGGIALGLVASIALTRFMASMLFGVSATDPLTFAAVVAVLLTMALLACYIPARRAMRVDPMVALRHE